MQLKRHVLALAALGLTGTPVWATNGMNMEGYGPIATGMGGASMAYDNGTAAVMNNPATLGLMGKGSRLDVALGFLGPDVSSTHLAGMGIANIGSGGDAYYMPAFGYVKSDGQLVYGVAVFAQGGMGTEYNRSMDNRPERSELGVGRVILPLAYKVSDALTLGGSLDFIWSMLDVKMVMPIASMAGLITQPGNGTLAGALTIMMGNGYDAARLEFSDGSDFSGKAKATGWAGKLGLTYKAAPGVTLGAAYHFKTGLGDMKTGSTGASMIVSDLNGPNPTQTVPGKITVRDFQWPETYALGIAVELNLRLMLAADYKRLNWKDVMKNFTMTYAAMGDAVTFALPQNWDDQDVFQLGVAYKATDALTLRAGVNLADNPIPNNTVHYLFPAIVKNHYTLGLGYDLSKASGLNFSLTHAPEVKQTNTAFGYRVEHSQTNWQLMYTHRF
ncbi:MAG: outer membrane protein transport protein [Thiobacillaceae bacterium]|nr:outer membrane protein transport protein [Thiobacillaceae bacterium]